MVERKQRETVDASLLGRSNYCNPFSIAVRAAIPAYYAPRIWLPIYEFPFVGSDHFPDRVWSLDVGSQTSRIFTLHAETLFYRVLNDHGSAAEGSFRLQHTKKSGLFGIL